MHFPVSMTLWDGNEATLEVKVPDAKLSSFMNGKDYSYMRRTLVCSRNVVDLVIDANHEVIKTKLIE